MVPLDDLFADPKYGLGGSEILFEGPTQEEIIPKFLQECRFNGHYYAIPYMRSTEACYINKTYVEALGFTLPETLTWDFVWEVCEAAMAQDSQGNYLLNGQKVLIPFIYKSTDNMMIQMLHQLDAGYSNARGEVQLFNDTTRSLLHTIAEQVEKGLNEAYEGKVTVKNVAVGGTQSEWGSAAAQINSIVENVPDLVMVHFGINDAGSGVTPASYAANIEKLIIDVQARVPECEFMLIKAFTPNTANYDPEQFRKYWVKLDNIAEEYEDAYTLDMYTLSKTMLTQKKYMDVTGNGINHVNDFSSRLYTMNILSALVKY